MNLELSIFEEIDGLKSHKEDIMNLRPPPHSGLGRSGLRYWTVFDEYLRNIRLVFHSSHVLFHVYVDMVNEAE